jgi:RNA polymerase sigma factor for flagellar operon FliA
LAEDYEPLLASHLGAVERVVAFVCRRNRLSADDADEFGGVVRLKLVEDNYAMLRAFEGRSSLQTYLTVVIQRLYLDFRISQWGKWRPSAEARRLGPTAVLFERLTTRDGLTAGEARMVMRANHGVTETDAELDAIAARLPHRTKRRVVSDEALIDIPGSSHDGEVRVLRAEAEAENIRGFAALEAALADLTTQDRLIIKYRFEHGLQVVQIARLMHLEQKPLYRRIEGILRALRIRLEAAGVDATVVRRLCDDDQFPAELTSSSGNPGLVSVPLSDNVRPFEREAREAR